MTGDLSRAAVIEVIEDVLANPRSYSLTVTVQAALQSALTLLRAHETLEQAAQHLHAELHRRGWASSDCSTVRDILIELVAYHHEPGCQELSGGDCTCDPHKLGWTHGPLDVSGDEPASAKPDYPDPTEADLVDPQFEAVWQAIKTWDLSREQPTEGHRMYHGANGNDVMHILNALRAQPSQATLKARERSKEE